VKTAVSKTSENCGLDQPRLAFEGRDGNVKVLQRTLMHDMNQKYLVGDFLTKYDINSSARHILRPYTFVWISFVENRICMNISVKSRFFSKKFSLGHCCNTINGNDGNDNHTIRRNATLWAYLNKFLLKINKFPKIKAISSVN
jgi:hypothetical protein